MGKYGKFYNYHNPKLGKLNMLVIGQTIPREQLTDTDCFFDAHPMIEDDKCIREAEILSANHLLINQGINTKDELRKQVEYARKVFKETMFDERDEYLAEVLFYNTDKPDTARLRMLSVNSNFRYKEDLGGYGLGKDIVQGAVKEMKAQGYSHMEGESTPDGIPFYKALGCDIRRVKIETRNEYYYVNGKFTTPVTNPKLVTHNKFELDPQLSDWATEIINNR